MGRFSTRIVMIVALALLVSAAPAAAFTVDFSFGDLAASAEFTAVGGQIQIVLTNTSASDVLIPSQILTAFFFDLANAGNLSPVSAILTAGSTVFFDPDGQPAGGDVGGEWQYLAGLVGAPNGATEGISSAGFGLFGQANFGATNLDGPTAVDGMQYGILSAGDDTTTGNAAVTGGNPLIQNSVTFLLSTDLLGGIPDDFDFDANLSNWSFQYGTALTEPNCVGTGCFPTVPEPSTLALLGLGLLGMAGGVRRLQRSRRP